MGINFDFDMKFTDNPYIDLIVHSVKILGMNAVIKNENQALNDITIINSINAIIMTFRIFSDFMNFSSTA